MEFFLKNKVDRNANRYLSTEGGNPANNIFELKVVSRISQTFLRSEHAIKPKVHWVIIHNIHIMLSKIGFDTGWNLSFFLELTLIRIIIKTNDQHESKKTSC
uniref:Uncharacterized protein n=1 Tax=Cacopsylla melanoneura TaxID=428564 RepID=A0A8D8XHX0_9HEMI